MKLSKKQRDDMIRQVIKQVEDWDLNELLSYVQSRMGEQLSNGSDTFIQLEYKTWVDPDYEMP